VGKVTTEQLNEIVRLKAADLNARDEEHARRMIAGTCRSMGIELAD
jgi:large subunit ribosomal protein L11